MVEWPTAETEGDHSEVMKEPRMSQGLIGLALLGLLMGIIAGLVTGVQIGKYLQVSGLLI